MSTMRNRFGVLGALLVLSAFLAGVGTVLADPPPDPLEMTRKEAELKASKLLTEVNANFAEARKYERSDPEKAQAILRQNRLLIEEDDVSLTERQRSDLKQQIERRLRDINAQVAAYKLGKDEAATRSDFEAKLAKDAANANSGPRPSDVVYARQKQAADIAQAKKEQAKMMKDLQQAYLDRILGRNQAAPESQKPGYQSTSDKSQKLSDTEISLIRALNSTLSSVKFEATPLKDVFSYIEDKTQGALTIVPDEEDLKGKIELTEPITFKGGKKVAVRTILHKILRDKKLDFYIEDGMIIVASIEKAEGQKVTKLYPVSKLVTTPGQANAQQMMMQQMMQQQMMQRQPQMMPQQRGRNGQLMQAPGMPNAQGGVAALQKAAQDSEINNVKGLVLVLESTVEPKYWDMNGGPGKMDYFPQTKSLIVSASQEMHYMLIASGMLRNVPPQPQE